MISVLSTIIILGIYGLRVYTNYLADNPELLNDFKFWGKSFLILIPVMVVAQIIIQIIFAIINAIVTKKETAEITDERDKLIDLKAIRVSHWTFCAGFLMAMGSQAIGMQPYVMFITLIGSCFIAGIAEGITQIYYYRKGG
jgi:hypothetical protein